MPKINKSDLIKLQVLKAMQDLVKNGLYKSCVFISTNSVKSLGIEVYCKEGVWTPYMLDFESCEEGGVLIGHCEGEEEISKELDNYTLTSFTVYHG